VSGPSGGPARAPEAGQADRRMLEALVCPVTRGPLIYDAGRQELVSRGAGLAYPINNGIPVMLVDEARRLED
jgi:uncharacterized protein YbaR (Trm112 family)